MVALSGAFQSLVELGQESNLLCVTGAGDTAHTCHGQCIFMLQAPVWPLGRKYFQGWWCGSHDVGYLKPRSLERKEPKKGLVDGEMPL